MYTTMENAVINLDDLRENWNAKNAEDSLSSSTETMMFSSLAARGITKYADATRFGLKILDWDDSFSKRLTYYSVSDLYIPFQYIEAIPTWSKISNYNDISDVMGRYEAVSIYTNSASQDLTLDLHYYAEARDNSGITDDGRIIKIPWTMVNIENIIKKLQSTVFPQYDGSYGPPTKLILNIGNEWRNVPVIMTSVEVEPKQPYDVLTGLSMYKTVKLQMKVQHPIYQSISQASVFGAYGSTKYAKGVEVFAYEKLNPKYSIVSNAVNNNAWTSQF